MCIWKNYINIYKQNGNNAEIAEDNGSTKTPYIVRELDFKWNDREKEGKIV
jgi:hypothetical protein